MDGEEEVQTSSNEDETTQTCTNEGTQETAETLTCTNEGTQGTTETLASSNEGTQNDEKSISRTTPVLEIIENNTGAVAANVAGDSEIIAGEKEGGTVETIALIGKAVWTVMKDNAPVVDETTDNASAVPAGAGLFDVDGFDASPRVMKLHYHTESPLGTNKTDIYLTCRWYFNGRYKGKGQYIKAATVLASGDAAWGNKVNIKAEINTIINIGTSEDPVALMPVKITLQESNMFQSITSIWDGKVQGNGAGLLSPIGA